MKIYKRSEYVNIAQEASQWRLMVWKFRKHKIALISSFLLPLLYIGALLSKFLSPYLPDDRFPEYSGIPPQTIHISDENGLCAPYVYGLSTGYDQQSFKRITIIDTDTRYPVNFFAHGKPYKVFGLFDSDFHLLTCEGPMFLFGTDQSGRDLFTRVLYGSRISLSVGLVGIFITMILGISLGGISGYFGGRTDDIIQRVIDFIVCVPTIPLWMVLAAAFPRSWPQYQIYICIVAITSITGWTGLARVVRGKMLSVRQEGYVLAAQIAGASNSYVIRKHMIPSFASYIIVSLTMSIPGTILGETSLSFLGLGLMPPVISWGVLLKDVQNLESIAMMPWLLIPALFVITTMILFNFLGDGLRDAMDPYKMDGA